MKNIKHFVLAISLLGAGSARAIGFAPIVGYFMPKVANPTRWEQFVALASTAKDTAVNYTGHYAGMAKDGVVYAYNNPTDTLISAKDSALSLGNSIANNARYVVSQEGRKAIVDNVGQAKDAVINAAYENPVAATAIGVTATALTGYVLYKKFKANAPVEREAEMAVAPVAYDFTSEEMAMSSADVATEIRQMVAQEDSQLAPRIARYTALLELLNLSQELQGQ